MKTDHSEGSLCHRQAQKAGQDARSVLWAVLYFMSRTDSQPFSEAEKRLMEGGREGCQLPATAPSRSFETCSSRFFFLIAGLAWTSATHTHKHTHTHTQNTRMIFRAAKIWNQPINHFHTHLDSQSNRSTSLSGRRKWEVHRSTGEIDLNCQQRLEGWVREPDWDFNSRKTRKSSHWIQKLGELIY